MIHRVLFMPYAVFIETGIKEEPEFIIVFLDKSGWNGMIIINGYNQ